MTKIFPLGGISGVTKNLFVYEHNDDMLVVDCGIGFPDETMPGVEFLIPDSQYLQDRLAQGATLHAIVLSHGHDDHIAALPYVLREIDVDVPIFGSPLTAEFAMTRMADNGVEKEVQYFEDDGVLEFGPFQVENIRITHSIPDTRHLVIRTPDGVFYHGSDFKLDLTPVDGIPSDLQRVAEIGREGVLCAAIDCLRIERPLPAASESSVGAAIREEMRDVEGKVLVTLMSSSIHRIQQAVDVAAEYGRKVAFIGRSVEQNVNTAMNMGLLDIPQDMKVNKRRMDDIPDSELCVIIAGSQGQPGSSLVRAVFGSHRMISVSKGDKIIFSSDAIPGSEKDVYRTINRIASQGIEVAYAEMNPGLHVSGHASEYEQMILLHLLQPEYVSRSVVRIAIASCSA
ncbi:ribonuclease J [Candidatus Woesebacteria bacterium]|nr:ribonuclease J [Candidatus Woesebacteria bacterium]